MSLPKISSIVNGLSCRLAIVLSALTLLGACTSDVELSEPIEEHRKRLIGKWERVYAVVEEAEMMGLTPLRMPGWTLNLKADGSFTRTVKDPFNEENSYSASGRWTLGAVAIENSEAMEVAPDFTIRLEYLVSPDVEIPIGAKVLDRNPLTVTSFAMVPRSENSVVGGSPVGGHVPDSSVAERPPVRLEEVWPVYTGTSSRSNKDTITFGNPMPRIGINEKWRKFVRAD